MDQDLDTLLRTWVGAAQPVTVVDLSRTPPTVLEQVVGALLRIVYDARFWARDLGEGARERPLLVVLEEAHAYLNPGSGEPRVPHRSAHRQGGTEVRLRRDDRQSATERDRSDDLVPVRHDRGHAARERDRPAPCRRHRERQLGGLLAMLPVLRTGEPIAVGEAVNLPMRVLVEPPSKDRRPQTSDPLVFVDGSPGNRPRGPEDYAGVVAVWRRQNPRSARIAEGEAHDATDRG